VQVRLGDAQHPSSFVREKLGVSRRVQRSEEEAKLKLKKKVVAVKGGVCGW